MWIRECDFQDIYHKGRAGGLLVANSKETLVSDTTFRNVSTIGRDFGFGGALALTETA